MDPIMIMVTSATPSIIVRDWTSSPLISVLYDGSLFFKGDEPMDRLQGNKSFNLIIRQIGRSGRS